MVASCPDTRHYTTIDNGPMSAAIKVAIPWLIPFAPFGSRANDLMTWIAIVACVLLSLVWYTCKL